MDTARNTSPNRPPGGNLPSGTAGIACPSGRMTCGQVSCSGSLSAGSAPDRASARRPLTWTMCGTTGETGRCLRTGTTCKVFATPATAARPCGSCGKTGGKIQAVAGGERASFGRGCAAWARRRAWARNFSKFPSPSPRGEKVSAGWRKTASLPSCGIFSPRKFSGKGLSAWIA